jgi:hypothetical protein
MLERKLADANVSEEEQNNILKDFKKGDRAPKETQKWALTILNC